MYCTDVCCEWVSCLQPKARVFQSLAPNIQRSSSTSPTVSPSSFLIISTSQKFERAGFSPRRCRPPFQETEITTFSDDAGCHELQLVCHCEVGHCEVEVEDEDAAGGLPRGSLQYRHPGLPIDIVIEVPPSNC